MGYVGEDNDTKRMMEKMKASRIEEANSIRHNDLNNKKVKEIKINGKMVLIGTIASLALLAAIIGTKKHNDKMERTHDHSVTNYATGETFYYDEEVKSNRIP